jgi:hypothetical protein
VVASRSDVVSVTPVIIVLVVGMIIINWWWVRAISREFSHGLAHGSPASYLVASRSCSPFKCAFARSILDGHQI